MKSPPGQFACLLILAACTPGAEIPGSSAQGSPPPAEVRAFVRPCESAVIGDLGRNWRREAVVSGPLALLGVHAHRRVPARSFEPRGQRYPSWKVLVVVGRGRSVTLMVSPFDGQPVRLLYDESGWRDDNRYRLSEGDPAVTFEPCEDRRVSQFNGSFVMRGPRCVQLEVWVEGERQSRALRIPFGRNVSC